ncbi:MAG: hypothetical protein ACLQLC_04625 [Candidatus Sulfotelmatobacter sp.]
MFELADSALEGQAADLKRFLEARKNIPEAQVQAEIGANFKIERSRDYVQIGDPRGNLIYRSQFFVEHPLPAISADDLDRPSYSSYKSGSERLRIISAPVEVGGRSYIVRLGTRMNEEYETLMDLRRTMLGYGFFIFLIASAASYGINRRMLSTFDDPARVVSDRDL